MIVITRYRLEKDHADKHKIRIKSEEESICPICSSETLKVIGSRNRGALDNNGEKVTIVIRRLRCIACRKIHHELPDFLVPYKRYLSECIEAIIEGEHEQIACEGSTIYRLRRWFYAVKVHIKGSLASVSARNRAGMGTAVTGATILNMIKVYVGKEPGWLSRAVRTVVNTNNWVHTRNAFMT